MLSYVYIVKNKSTKMFYIGVKYAKNAHPGQLWVTYFTSSNRVRNLIKKFGEDDFTYRILAKFDSKYSALEFERNAISKYIKHPRCLNQHTNCTGDEDSFNAEQKAARHRGKVSGQLSKNLGTGIFGMSTSRKREVCSKAGELSAKINRKLGRGIFDPEVRKRQHETLKRSQKSAYYDPILRSEITSKGGKSGTFSEKYRELHGITFEEHVEAQRERGKRGGPKNRGFKWYTDGKDVFKYTKKEQEECPFEEFLSKNTQFRPGCGSILHKPSASRILVNDGKRNFRVDHQESTNGKYKIGGLPRIWVIELETNKARVIYEHEYDPSKHKKGMR